MTLDLLLDAPTLAIRIAPIIGGIVLILFVLVAILLTFIVLIQEGKGGGIAGAFGGAAAESFGVKAGSVNRFTAWLATLFVGLALVHGAINAYRTQSKVDDGGPAAPVVAPVPGGPDGGMTDGAGMGTAPAGTDGGMTDGAMGDVPPAPPTPPPPAMEEGAMGDGTPPTPPPAPPAPAPEPAMEPGTPPAPADPK